MKLNPFKTTKTAVRHEKLHPADLWDLSLSRFTSRTHALVIGPNPASRAEAIASLLHRAHSRDFPAIVISPVEADTDRRFGAFMTVTDALAAAQLLRSLHSEMRARMCHLVITRAARRDVIPALIVAVDGFDVLTRRWDEIAAEGEKSAQELLKALNPIDACRELVMLARSSGIIVVIGAHRNEAIEKSFGRPEIVNSFGTRIGLPGLSPDDAHTLMGAHIAEADKALGPIEGFVIDGSEISQAPYVPNDPPGLAAAPTPAFTAFSDTFARFLADNHIPDVVDMT